MSAQRQNSSARSPNVPQQQLQNGRGTYNLHSFGMLCPAHGVADRASLLGTGSRSEHLSCFQKNILRNSAVALDHLRRVTREVAFQHLEHTSRIFEGWICRELIRLLRLAATIFAM